MKIAVITFISIAFSFSAKGNTAAYFKVDFNAIEREFLPLNKLQNQIQESGALQDAPLSTFFELPLDSSGNDIFPIMGIPTFWLVFAPTCAANCFPPCGGVFVGVVSFAYVRHFGQNEEESRKAFAGCLAGQAPVFLWVAVFFLSSYGI